MLVLAEQAFRKLHATKLTANIYLEVNYVNGIAMEGTVGVVVARSCLNKNGRDISRPVAIANLNSTGMGGVGSLVWCLPRFRPVPSTFTGNVPPLFEFSILA